MAGRITNAVLAEKIDATNDNVKDIKDELVKLNGRTFKNSTDIAKMKGASGVIAFVVSIIVTVIGICVSAYLKVRQICG